MQSAQFGWAVLGPGAIAVTFVAALRAVPGARLRAVWGRDAGRAQAFALRHGLHARCAAAELDAVLDDPQVHAVYVATTHDAHAGLAARALAAGKPVLCEKPLTLCEADTRELCALSRAHRVFLMEGLWTRMLPLYRALGSRLAQAGLGELRSVTSNFCFVVPYEARSRLFDPARGGGALLDIGVYNVAMTRWAVHSAGGVAEAVVARSLDSLCAPDGVDIANVGSLRFAGGTVAQFVCAFDRIATNGLQLHGTRGSVWVPQDFWAGQRAEWIAADGSRESLHMPHAVNGFEYQIEEAMRCIREGRIESPGMPHAESVAVAREIDALRALATAGGRRLDARPSAAAAATPHSA